MFDPLGVYFPSHPYAMYLECTPLPSHKEIRDYCEEDLHQDFRAVSIGQRSKGMTTIGWIVRFRDPLAAVQFKLRWECVDYEVRRPKASDF